MTHTINETVETIKSSLTDADKAEMQEAIKASKELHEKIQAALVGQPSNIALATLAQLMCVIYDDYMGEEANTQDFAMRMAVVHKGRRVLVNGEGQTKQ